MSTFRLISRLDVKPPFLVKGVHLEGVRKLGDPVVFADDYYLQGIDEIYYQDVVASLYGRSNLYSLVNDLSSRIFVPFALGGGIRSVDDIYMALDSGADKVTINSAAILDPSLINKSVHIFGSQCVSVAIEYTKLSTGKWTPLYHSGREKSHLDAVAWAAECSDRGAGEIILTSIDREGTKKGLDLELGLELQPNTSCPLLLHGGIGNAEHVLEAAVNGFSGVIISSALHFRLTSISQIRTLLTSRNISVRPAS